MNDIKIINSIDEQGDVDTISRSEVKKPPRYKVLLHNDDYTTMEFVIYILRDVFGKSTADAQDIMLKIHQKGIGICGVYTHEIAETKMERVKREAKEEGYPLLCTIEEE
jgi:ATP-dependent Clp protease adaptor protein ClpS